MKNGFFITAGIFLIIALFLLPGRIGPMWQSLLLSSGAIAALLAGIAYYLYRQNPGRHLLVPAVVVLLIFSTSIAAALYAHHQGTYQHELLIEIRSTIDRGILIVYMNSFMLEMMHDYHAQQGEVDFDELFNEKHAGELTTDSLLVSYFAPILAEDLREYGQLLRVMEVSPDRIIVSGESVIGKGISPKFENITGSTGRIQLVGTLTKEGIFYERRN